MTDYRNPSDAEIDHKSPLTETLMTALRDNPIAISEGADNAPRMKLKALDRVAAGSNTRLNYTGTNTDNSNTVTSKVLEFGIAQIGTIRAEMTEAVSSTMEIFRTRSGTKTQMVTGNTSVTVDFSVVHGDLITFQGLGTGSDTKSYTCKIKTDGGDLWAGVGASLEGNDV